MNALEFTGVGVRLGDVEALREVTFSIDARTTAVVGDNGSGKSTIARLAAGLARADDGVVRVLGLDPARESAALRRRVAVVFSNPDAQIVMPTVAEDVAFSLRGAGLAKPELRAAVASALDRFGIGELADRSAHELSGGQKQLLAVCGAFVRQPELVIADEPTAALDRRNARRIADHLFAAGDHRLLLVTHDLDLARRCDAALLVADGGIAAIGDAHDVVRRYEEALRC